ncbi:MAG: LemA family protein [Cardiobacteriaceae bacterium]|nr:LemA family protein [Cardiobacteriaceae bacterium]
MYLIYTILVLLVIAIIYAVILYNRIIIADNRIKNADKQILVQLNRRFDLIPNLVKTVQKYMAYEAEVLEKIAQTRGGNTPILWEKSSSGDEFRKALANIYARVENYPELKADKQIAALNEELVSTENRVAFARQHFNDAVNFYNNLIGQFPSNFIAAKFNFQEKEYLNLPEYPLPKVNF